MERAFFKIIFIWIFILIKNDCICQCNQFIPDTILKNLTNKSCYVKQTFYSNERVLNVYNMDSILTISYIFFNDKLIAKKDFVIKKNDTTYTIYGYNKNCDICSIGHFKNIIYDESFVTNAKVIYGPYKDFCENNVGKYITYYDDFGNEIGPAIYYNDKEQVICAMMFENNETTTITNEYVESTDKLIKVIFSKQNSEGQRSHEDFFYIGDKGNRILEKTVYYTYTKTGYKCLITIYDLNGLIEAEEIYRFTISGVNYISNLIYKKKYKQPKKKHTIITNILY